MLIETLLKTMIKTTNNINFLKYLEALNIDLVF